MAPPQGLKSTSQMASPSEAWHAGAARWWWALKNPQALPSEGRILLPPLGSGRTHSPAQLPGGEGGGEGVVYISARCLLPFVPGPPAQALHCAVQGHTWLRRGMEGMGYGPHRSLPLNYAPPLTHFLQRPGMSPGSRMPMAGLQVGPPAGSPFGTAAPLRPGMPPTMMDPFRKRLLVPQAQPPMPTQRRG